MISPVGVVQFTVKAEKRLVAGHPWVFASDITSHPGRAGVVQVLDSAGRVFGQGLFSPESTIALRLLKRGEKPFSDQELVQRLVDADRRRAPLGRASYRMVHGEADFLPGMFIERYGNVFVFQSTCAGADALEAATVAVLRERFAAQAIVIRNNAAVRSRENLPQEIRIAHGEGPVRVEHFEGELRYEVDLLGEQKTGAFLDQVDNHVLVRRYAHGRAFDGFSYHGGFALQMAAAGCEVTAADQSRSALETLTDRARSLELSVSTIESDVTELLPAWAEEGQAFNTVVIDPPAFASTRATVKRALRAYGELNCAAFGLLRRGGVLVTCSCSGQVNGEAFDDMLASAARRSGKRVQVLERRGAGIDHPTLLGVPETEYLKCRILRVV